jgi:hypothetical protein
MQNYLGCWDKNPLELKGRHYDYLIVDDLSNNIPTITRDIAIMNDSQYYAVPDGAMSYNDDIVLSAQPTAKIVGVSDVACILAIAAFHHDSNSWCHHRETVKIADLEATLVEVKKRQAEVVKKIAEKKAEYKKQLESQLAAINNASETK